MQQNYTLKELPKIAKTIIATASSKTLLFNGKMGVGKTTLIKEVVKQLGVQEVVNSPTFSLINEYITNDGQTIYHFDFYRIKTEEEALDIGIEEYFYDKNAWCLIEWGNKVENLLPLEIVNINLVVNTKNQRTIEIESL